MGRKSRKPSPEDLFTKGQEFFEDGRMEQAETTLQQARELATSLGDMASMGPILNLLAGVYRATDRTAEALDACLSALALAQETDSMTPQHIGYVHDNIAQILTRLDRPADAVDHYKKSTELMMADEEEPDVESTLRSIHALAELLGALGRDDEAMEQLARGVAVARGATVWHSVADACSEYLGALVDAGRAAEAEQLMVGVLADLDAAFAVKVKVPPVFNPEAMAFEQIKREHLAKGTAPVFMLRLLILLSHARAAQGIDDGVPGNLPALSHFEEEMMAYASEEWSQSHLELAIEMHLLAQAGNRPSAFEAAETLYRKAADIAREDDDPETVELLLDNIRANLGELFEDTGRDPATLEI